MTQREAKKVKINGPVGSRESAPKRKRGKEDYHLVKALSQCITNTMDPSHNRNF